MLPTSGRCQRDLTRTFEESRLAAQCWASAYELFLPIVRRPLPRTPAADATPTKQESYGYAAKSVGGRCG